MTGRMSVLWSGCWLLTLFTQTTCHASQIRCRSVWSTSLYSGLSYLIRRYDIHTNTIHCIPLTHCLGYHMAPHCSAWCEWYLAWLSTCFEEATGTSLHSSLSIHCSPAIFWYKLKNSFRCTEVERIAVIELELDSVVKMRKWQTSFLYHHS